MNAVCCKSMKAFAAIALRAFRFNAPIIRHYTELWASSEHPISRCVRTPVRHVFLSVIGTVLHCCSTAFCPKIHMTCIKAYIASTQSASATKRKVRLSRWAVTWRLIFARAGSAAEQLNLASATVMTGDGWKTSSVMRVHGEFWR